MIVGLVLWVALFFAPEPEIRPAFLVVHPPAGTRCYQMFEGPVCMVRQY